MTDKTSAAPAPSPPFDRWLWRVALTGAIVVLALGYGLEILGFIRNTPSHLLGLSFFRLDDELSLPALCESLLMLTVAVLAFRTGRRERGNLPRTSLAWTLLGVGFVYLALDEYLAIHEVFSRWTAIPQFGGFLRHKWLVVGIPAVTVVAVLFIPFLLKIPRVTALRLIIGGAVFVGGAIGAEAVGGMILDQAGTETTGSIIVSVVEETLEYIGLLLGIRALLLHEAAKHEAAA